MARIRTIKPEFWTSEQVVECSVNARLLFIGLWNFCDDAGRIEDSPRQIKMKIFPGDDFTTDDIHGMLTELSVNGLIIRYAAENRAFIQVTGWHHQKINRPNPSKIPPPPKNTHGALTEPHLPEGKGKEGKGRERKGDIDKPSSSIDSLPRAKDAAVAFADRLFEITGIDPLKIVSPRWHVEQTTLCRQWLALDLPPETIADAVVAVTRRQRDADPAWAPRSLRYFDAAVRQLAEGGAVRQGNGSAVSQAQTDRERLLERAKQRGLRLLLDSEERMFVRLELLEQTGKWLPEWGEPWEPASGITRALYDEFREPIERLRKQMEGIDG